jgi:hypothetical protein
MSNLSKSKLGKFAAAIAMNLAPLLGYKDYHLLLRDVSTPKPMSSNQRWGISQISSAVMY